MSDVNISKYRAQVIRQGSTPASPGFAVAEGQNPVDPSGSGQTHLPVTIATATTGLSITESQILSGAGLVSQYIRGDGSLADFPATTGGGSSVSYYLNGSVSQGTIGGVAYKQLNRTPVFGAGTDFTINADGYIASFITDASDPNKLLIPAGNWNFETYFSASSSGGSPSFYVELYKYDGTTFTLIATSSSAPELIAFGTSLNPYYSTLAVPQTVLALTDRLAIRYYVTHSGRTITLHTEDNHLCQIITTFTTGITALNGLTAQVQNFAVGTSGTDFAIASATATHTFNLPTASASNRGALSSSDWTTFNNKTSNLGTVTSVGLSSATSGVTIGSTPVTTSGTITLAIATASGSQNGLLSSTDWTTFNGKQNALTNPVTGTGTTNYLPKFTGASTIGNSNIQDNGSLVSVGVAANFSSSVTALSLDVISASGVGSSAATGLARFITAGTSNGIAVGQSNSLRYTAILANEHIIYNDDFFMRTNGNFPLSIGTNNTTNLRFFSDGNILIQTGGTFTNNGAKLQVSGTSTAATFETSAAINAIFNSTNASGGYIGFRRSGTSIGYLGNSAQLGIGVNNALELRADNNLYLTTTSGTLAMLSTGNVGIGTANPSTRLHVFSGLGGSSTTPILLLENDATSPQDFLKISDTGSTPLDVMVVKGNGNVLIGTTTDNGARLQVSGTATVSGNLQINDGTSGTSPKIAFGTETPSAQGFKGIYLESFWMYMQVHYNEGLRIRAVNGVGASQTIATFSGASGNLSILGALSKGSGSFKIDHPLPEKKDTHHLVHSFIEGPQADNIYRGKVQLVNGHAEVNIDEASGMTQGTFVLLNGNVQCFTSNESGWTAIKGRIDSNILTIESEDFNCNDTVSWMVIGERHDQHMIDTDWTDENGKVIVEPLKK